MSAGVKEFSKAASNAYRSITSAEKEALSLQCKERTDTLSAKAIKREGVKVFLKIQKLVMYMYHIHVGYTQCDLHIPYVV